MKDFALLIVVLVVFIYGYFLMEKLDRFLEENQSQKLISGSKLRIGFETPVIIDSIADLLEQFSSEYPNYELNLFYGSVSEIINGLENNKLDFGFIIESSNDILKDEYCSLSLQIKQSVINPDSADIAVHPINTIEKPARVIWRQKRALRARLSFRLSAAPRKSGAPQPKRQRYKRPRQTLRRRFRGLPIRTRTPPRRELREIIKF